MKEFKQILDAINVLPDTAIGAFNINDMTDIHGVINAGTFSGKPVILNTSTSAIAYAGIHFIREMFKAARFTCPVPIYLMLDHCRDFETTVNCIANGYSIVMFDGSRLPLEENIRQTGEIVRIAHSAGVLVEGEIGRMQGEEDVNSGGDNTFTDPAEAEKFYRETGVDLLAISFGTVHGCYQGEPRLNFDIIREVRERTGAPLVMHGGTGTPLADVQRAISLGIKKINYGTELKLAYSGAMRNYCAALGDETDPRKILKHARIAVQQVVAEKLDWINTPIHTDTGYGR